MKSFVSSELLAHLYSSRDQVWQVKGL